VVELGGHQCAGGRRYLSREAFDRGRVVGGEDERADAVLQAQTGQLLGPLLRRAVQE
jgi:hypothetical protein